MTPETVVPLHTAMLRHRPLPSASASAVPLWLGDDAIVQRAVDAKRALAHPPDPQFWQQLAELLTLVVALIEGSPAPSDGHSRAVALVNDLKAALDLATLQTPSRPARTREAAPEQPIPTPVSRLGGGVDPSAMDAPDERALLSTNEPVETPKPPLADAYGCVLPGLKADVVTLAHYLAAPHQPALRDLSAVVENSRLALLWGEFRHHGGVTAPPSPHTAHDPPHPSAHPTETPSLPPSSTATPNSQTKENP